MDYHSDHARIVILEKKVAHLESVIAGNGSAELIEPNPPENIDDPSPPTPEPLQPAQRLCDLVKPMDSKLIRLSSVSIGYSTPWRVFAGKDSCQCMYFKVREILDATMAYVCRVYPRENNNAFVVGDAGCWPGRSCPGHRGAHDNQYVVDLNYCTLSGFNMTHYQIGSMSLVNLWKDTYPYRYLKPVLFDTEKNYALYYMLKKIFPKSQILVSTGIKNHFKQGYGGSILQGDDTKCYNHHKHVHLSLNYRDIDWDAGFNLDYLDGENI
jgi:hypothetical protein